MFILENWEEKEEGGGVEKKERGKVKCAKDIRIKGSWMQWVIHNHTFCNNMLRVMKTYRKMNYVPYHTLHYVVTVLFERIWVSDFKQNENDIHAEKKLARSRPWLSMSGLYCESWMKSRNNYWCFQTSKYISLHLLLSSSDKGFPVHKRLVNS